jgi:hypothetical protein
MGANENIRDIQAHLHKTKQLLTKNREFYDRFRESDFSKLGPGTAAAMVFSQVFTDCYTIIETLFFRISQHFENSLSKSEWHKELLEKMRLEIPGVRKAAISDTTYEVCLELLRFRHFRRYYFELDYDWDRIELAEKKYLQVQELLPRDLDVFESFLREMLDA